MRIVFRVTKEDLRESIEYVEKQRKITAVVVALLVVLSLVGVGVGFFLLSIGDKIGSLMFIGLFATLPLLLWFRRSWLARRAMRAYPHYADEQRLDISGDKVVWAIRTVRVEHLWSSFDNWIETPNLLLLCRFDRHHNLIPKRAFEPQQLEEFARLLKDKVGKKEPTLESKPAQA